MFRSIVVPLDLAVIGDRALPIARSLAELGGLPIELVTITSPNMDGFTDAWELERRAKTHGIGPHSIQVLYDNDAGAAIIKHLSERDDALLVMGSTAKGPLAEQAFGSVSEHVLSHAHRPVVVVGPHADVTHELRSPTLIVGIDESDAAEAALAAIESWVDTFGRTAVRVVEVEPLAVGVGAAVEAAWDELPARMLARRLADRGIVASWDVFRGDDPAERLDDLAADVSDAVLVAASTQWTSEGVHWRSTTRTIARRSKRPVLVVPVS